MRPGAPDLGSLPKAQRWLIAVLALAVLAANVAQPFPRISPLHHIPTVLLIVASPWLLRRWPLSDTAVGCVVGFLLLHTLGARWTYSNVPYAEWWHALVGGTTDPLARNHYDRLVHLAFGVLAMRPAIEALRRHGGAGPRLAGWTAFALVGWGSAVYEIFEWLLTILAAPEVAADYNGQQGDVWDAQKDMALAITGAAVAWLAMAKRLQSR